MKNKITLISLILIFLTLLSTAASAAQVTKIGNGAQPAIDGTKVTWTNGGVIHVYDMTTNKDTTISSAAASYPAISGNKIVWNDKSTRVPRLTVYDIKSGARSQITRNIDANSVPAINGNRIVWSANGNVYMRDISRSIQIKIAAGNNPDIYGNKMSYHSDSAGDTPQIYVYDIATKNVVDVSEYGYNLYSHIYGNKVIWSDFNTRQGNIRMYDLVTKQQTEITTGDDTTGYDTGGSSDIYRDKVVYVKRHGQEPANPYIGIGDIYVYCTATGKSTQLFVSNTAKTPVVSGNVVVWSDSGNIYMTKYSCRQSSQ